jgi:hypothetical protein
LIVAEPRVLSLCLALAVAFGACAPKGPGKVVAMEPRPNPPLAKPPPDNPRDRLRQNRWLAQFWEELTPAQRRRVESRMRRSQPPLASNQEAAGMAWDGLGLAERDRLVFGGPASTRRATAAAAATSPESTEPVSSEGEGSTPAR